MTICIPEQKVEHRAHSRYSMLTQPLLVLASIVLATVCSSVVAAGEKAAATGPLRPSVSNPRYFTDGSQKAIYLTGSHTWANLQEMGTIDPPPKFDFSSYVKFMETHGHNFMRMWAWEQARWVPWTTSDVYVNPLPYIREGPDLALDGKAKFNLEKFNQKYFDRLRARVIEAGEHGIYVSIMLFNGWSVEPFEDSNLLGNPWRGHPFHRENNINGINGDVNGDDQGQETHTLSKDPHLVAVRLFQEAYIRKIVDTVNDLHNVLYEVGNEVVDTSTQWQYHMIRYIKEYEASKPYQHPVAMTYQGSQSPGEPTNSALLNSPADWISPGQIAVRGAPLNYQYRTNPPASDGKKVVLSDTDHLWGIGGDHTWVWKSFLRGLNPIFMDPWEPIPETADPKNNKNFHEWALLRTAMGDTLRYANRMDLAALNPRGDLSSTGYCLGNPGMEYLVYLPSDGHFGVNWFDRLHLHGWANWFSQIMGWSQTVSVDLSESSKAFHVEWFNPRTGETISGGVTVGGGRQSFTAPFSADAVLYLAADSSTHEAP